MATACHSTLTRSSIRRVTVHLIKPPIAPSIRRMESPVGYLFRLKEENCYGSMNWMSVKYTFLQSISVAAATKTIENSEWCSYQQNSVEKAITNLPNYYLNSSPRFCPHCIRENSIWSMYWHLSQSVACAKHGVWLLEHCPECGAHFGKIDSCIHSCSCGFHWKQAKTQPCPKVVQNMQCYIEDKASVAKVNGSPLISVSAKQTLADKLTFILKISHYTLTPTGKKMRVHSRYKIGNSWTRTAERAADALFGGTGGFNRFLMNLLTAKQPGKEADASFFANFYNIFHASFKAEYYWPFKRQIEEFVCKQFPEHVCSRNHHFIESTIRDHPWLSLSCACQTFCISKSTLQNAISMGLVEVKYRGSGRQKRTFVFSVDVLSVRRLLEKTVNKKEASELLNLPQHQFKMLTECGVFKRTKGPSSSTMGQWRFLKSELIQFARKLRHPEINSPEEVIILPKLISKYGHLIQNPLIAVFRGIKEGKIVAWKTVDTPHIRSWLVDERSFMTWLELNQSHAKGLSIQQVSRELGISEKSVASLVEAGLLDRHLYGTSGIIHITYDDILKFKSRYILLREVATKLGMGARVTMRYLAKVGIFPEVEASKRSISIKVYMRNAIEVLFEPKPETP